MPAKLKHGVIGCPGGKREGAGRKPDEFKAKCAELASNAKFLRWAEDVLTGEKVEFAVDKLGAVVPIPADVNQRTYLWEKLAAYGYGKPAQAINLGGNVRIGFLDLIGKAERERGLAAED